MGQLQENNITMFFLFSVFIFCAIFKGEKLSSYIFSSPFDSNSWVKLHNDINIQYLC